MRAQAKIHLAHALKYGFQIQRKHKVTNPWKKPFKVLLTVFMLLNIIILNWVNYKIYAYHNDFSEYLRPLLKRVIQEIKYKSFDNQIAIINLIKYLINPFWID